MLDAAALSIVPVCTRFHWRSVASSEAYSAVLLPGWAGPQIATNDRHALDASDLRAVTRWAVDCLERGETVAFLSLEALVAMTAPVRR